MEEEHYMATYCIGGTEVRLFDSSGRTAGAYGMHTIIAPAALGPIWFAFLTESGLYCINAKTGQTRCV